MKKQFQSLTEKGRWLIATLTLLFTLGIGQMWADELCSATLTGITASSNTTGISQTGCTMKWSGLAVSGSDVVTIGTSTYHKFSGSGSYVQLVLSSGSFQANDIVTVRIAGKDSGKKTVKFSLKSDSGNSASGSASKTATDDVSYTLTADDIETDGSIKIFRAGTSNSRYGSFSVTRSSGGGGGGDPVDPEFTYTPATYVIGDPALDLSTKLSSTNTTGAITFAIKDAAGTGASIANSKNFTATTAGIAKVTVSQEASTGYNAKSQDIDVTVAAPDPCTTHFYFYNEADQTSNGKTNSAIFKNTSAGSSNMNGSITIDGTTYNTTRRSGDPSSFANFDIPANKAGTFYTLAVSSGGSARKIVITNTATSATYEYDVPGGSSAYTTVTIPNLPTGSYSVGKSGGNTRLGMMALKVCDATFHTITLDLDGGTGATSIQALDGAPATKPADPTKAHCAFAGWVVKSTSAAYDWAANVTGDLTLKATWTQLYTVTYEAGDGTATGDAPMQADLANGEKFTVAANTFAVAGKDFVKWNDGTNDYAPGAEYTIASANVVLTAQWKAASAKYTVVFKDGDVTLGTKQFDVASNPSDADIDKTKALSTFAAWQKEGVDIALDDAFWATVVKDATVTLTARWAKAYATDIDFEAFIDAHGTSGDWGAELADKNYAISSTTSVTLDAPSGKPADKGLKIKNSGAYISFNVNAGKLVILKAGVLSGAEISVDGGANYTALTGATGSTAASVTSYHYNAAEAEYRIRTTTGSYNIIQAITITNPFQVTFNANGGEDVASLNGTPSVTLPSATKGTDSFLGWFDAAEGGNKIGEAGASYTPTADIELFAHWEAVSTDARLSSITFSSAAGTLSPAFDPEVVNYTYTMPYGTAAIPTITGATSVNAKAQDPIIGEAAAAWSGTQTIQGVAQSGDKKTYTITMAKAPKDGVCLIKGNVGNNTFVIDEEASLLSGTPSKNNVKSESSTYETLTGWKFNSRPAHLGLTLSEGTFQEGDVVEVFVTSEANGGGTTHKMRVFDAADATPAHVLAESAADMVQGANRLVLPATSTSSLYLHRGASGADYENWNPYVAYFAVYRPMNPMLTAMTIDGRTVTINEDAKTATVTIPYEAELANLTIAKTIVWNAPATENSIVVNGGSAWVIGENTYKLTDKDGDATTYTITVARDVLKHTVSFNTHGGSAVASVEVEHNANLTAVPNDPSKEDYIFQYWSLTDGGEEVDVTTVQINEDKEFHAVWVSDGGIKLLDGSTVNHTNFITAVTATETVEFKGNTVNYAKFSGTCSGVSSVKDLTRVIAYNATTNKTKIRISAHNNSTSGRSILVKGLVEGASAAVDLATIALGNKEDKVSDWIEFDNAANRTIYIMVGSSAGDVYFTQVKVIESGETPMKQVGEAGYALNMNKGRFFGLANTDLAFEGLNARLSGDYTALNSGYAKLASTSMSFTVASDMNLVVTTNNSKTYYVTKGAAGTDNETAKKGVSEFDLTAGTWYITAGSDEVQFTNIAFELPKAEKPVVAAMDDVEYCQGSAIDELAVSATVSDGGTMLYQWYKDGEIIAGAEAENYQPTADGEYYVEVVNTKTGYQNSDAVQSNTITVTGYAATVLSGTTGAENWPGEDATISVTASGKNLHYAWYTCDDAMGANPVAVDPAVDAAELNVTIAAADTYYKVVVSGDCGSAQEAVITVVARQAVELQDVTGDMSWDFSKANDGTAAGSNLCNDEVLANVHGIVNNSDFKSDNIKATANKFSSGKLQASMIMFHTTVGGIVTVVFSHTGNNKTDGRALVVNGTYQSELSHNQTAMTYKCYVPAGDVVLTSTTGDGGAMLNFTSVDFKAKAEADYTRNVSNNIGTLCVDHNVLVGGAMGATFYQIASRNELYNDKIDFEEVLPNEELKAGEPYIFHSNTGKIELFYGETVATEPVAVRGMIGSFVNTTLDITEENKSSIMYIAQNKLWNCEDLVVSDLEVVANRAYIVMSDVPTYAEYQEALQQQQNPAPRRRVTLGRNAEQVATGIGEVQGDKVQSTKVLIDGHIYILRGEKMFDAKGQLVK